MPRIAIGICAGLVVLGLYWWGIREEPEVAPPAYLPAVSDGTSEDAALSGRRRPDPHPEAPEPFADVEDPAALLRHLDDSKAAPAATARLEALIGSDTSRTLARVGEPGVALLFQLAGEGGAATRAHLPLAFHVGDSDFSRMLREMKPAFSSEADAVRLAAYQSLAGLDRLPEALLAPLLVRGLRDRSKDVRLSCVYRARTLKAKIAGWSWFSYWMLDLPDSVLARDPVAYEAVQRVRKRREAHAKGRR